MTTKPEWECVICYENGITTGQLTLACKHTVCLGCYTSMVSYYKPLTCPCCRSAINTGEKPLIHSDDDDRNELMSLLAVLDIDMELDEFLGPPIAPTGQGQERVRCIGCRNYFAPGQMARRRVRNTDGSLRPNRVLRCNGCGED